MNIKVLSCEVTEDLLTKEVYTEATAEYEGVYYFLMREERKSIEEMVVVAEEHVKNAVKTGEHRARKSQGGYDWLGDI